MQRLFETISNALRTLVYGNDDPVDLREFIYVNTLGYNAHFAVGDGKCTLYCDGKRVERVSSVWYRYTVIKRRPSDDAPVLTDVLELAWSAKCGERVEPPPLDQRRTTNTFEVRFANGRSALVPRIPFVRGGEEIQPTEEAAEEEMEESWAIDVKTHGVAHGV